MSPRLWSFVFKFISFLMNSESWGGNMSAASDLHSLMNLACNWSGLILFLLWLSLSFFRWIDLWLNSSLFSLDNNYVVMQSRGPGSGAAVCYQTNHLQSFSGLTWKMSCAQLHEGVKLPTPLCPRPCASEGISSFIDSVAGSPADGGCRHPPPALIAFVSRSPPIYRCNFSNFSGLVVWRQKAVWETHAEQTREMCSLSPPPQLHQSNHQINVWLH